MSRSRLIHLTAFHDYKARDPIRLLDPEEQRQIRHYLQYYHGYPHAELTAVRILQCLPAVMEKIASNLRSYVVELEKC